MIGRKTVFEAVAQIVPRADHCISRADINPNALKVLKKLDNAGFESFLVGGGVRDLLLRKAPKDFDVATSATPEQVKKLFKNCRLIGKRFPLAHVHFGREIIEVATFRSLDSGKPKDKQSKMIWRDNNYGTLAEDAYRRDFTVNALYYNIADFSVVDFHQGMTDLKDRKLKMIGDPKKRYAEDPVRMLRAIRFATKLNFTIEEGTAEPIRQMAAHLREVSASRLFEEFIKLFHYGHARENFIMLSEYGLLEVLFPDVDKLFKDSEHSIFILNCLDSTDARVRLEKPVTPTFLLAAFLWPVMNQLENQYRERGLNYQIAAEKAMKEVIRDQNVIISISKRLSSMIREMWQLQHRLERRSVSRSASLLHHPRFRAAYDLLVLRAKVGEIDEAIANWWTDFQIATDDKRAQMLIPFKDKKNSKRRKKNGNT